VATRTATRRQNPMSLMVWAAVTTTGSSPLVLSPQEWNWTVSDTFRKLCCYLGPVNTSTAHHGVFNKTLPHHMAQTWPKTGFRVTSQRSLAKMNGPQEALIWILSTFLCRLF
jgi:hypothetical protein